MLCDSPGWGWVVKGGVLVAEQQSVLHIEKKKKK